MVPTYELFFKIAFLNLKVFQLYTFKINLLTFLENIFNELNEGCKGLEIKTDHKRKGSIKYAKKKKQHKVSPAKMNV